MGVNHCNRYSAKTTTIYFYIDIWPIAAIRLHAILVEYWRAVLDWTNEKCTVRPFAYHRTVLSVCEMVGRIHLIGDIFYPPESFSCGGIRIPFPRIIGIIARMRFVNRRPVRV